MATYKEQYNKQLKRIKQDIYRAKKRGYIVPDSVIPVKPKTITKASVERLRKITPTTIYSKSSYNVEPNKVVSGLEGRKIEKRRATEKGIKTRKLNLEKARAKFYKNNPQAQGDTEKWKKTSVTTEVLKNIRNEINQWSPDINWGDWFTNQKRDDKNILSRTLEGAIASEGEDVVAKRLENNADRVQRIVMSILYSSGGGKTAEASREQLNFELAEFSAIIMGRSGSAYDRMELEDSYDAL